jgi:anaerobic dimethyl sulfoxide reductase subunit B (iron-sulfur subunit)
MQRTPDMLKQYGIYVDVGRCVQCHACETACKVQNDIEPGVKWRMVVDVWKGQYPAVRNRSMPYACHHCAEPACESACPTGAISKRASDGIVTVDKHRCIGCRSCQLACPFGIPQFGSDGRMQKCNLCMNRLALGREPACVATCPAEALFFGSMEELNRLSAEKSGRKLASASLATPGIGSPKVA